MSFTSRVIKRLPGSAFASAAYTKGNPTFDYLEQMKKACAALSGNPNQKRTQKIMPEVAAKEAVQYALAHLAREKLLFRTSRCWKWH